MISMKLTKDFIDELDSLPRSWVFYALRSETEYLYASVSVNLGARLKNFWQKRQDDSLIAELMSKAKYLDYQPMPDSMSALIMLKTFLFDNYPSYQQRLQPWAEYVYLALDSHRFPFITIQQHTNDEWNYLGPFRSRFFLTDLLDSLSRILKLPYCETGTYPCDKFERGICRGWCLALAPAKETKLEHDLDKLDTLIKETFLHPNNGILEMVQKERDNYFNNLEFAKADLLDDEINLLSKYRDWLNFLYVTKELDFENSKITIRKGQLARAELNGKTYNFHIDSTEHRENEKLALPLNRLDEAKIIYDYIKELSHA